VPADGRLISVERPDESEAISKSHDTPTHRS
jgi:hypothetical protein